MPTGIENLNTAEEGVKELTSVESRILENAEEIGNDILILAKTSNEISIVFHLEECRLSMITTNSSIRTKNYWINTRKVNIMASDGLPT